MLGVVIRSTWATRTRSAASSRAARQTSDDLPQRRGREDDHVLAVADVAGQLGDLAPRGRRMPRRGRAPRSETGWSAEPCSIPLMSYTGQYLIYSPCCDTHHHTAKYYTLGIRHLATPGIARAGPLYKSCPGHGPAAAMNFIEDVVEAFPAARRALIEVDAARRDPRPPLRRALRPLGRPLGGIRGARGRARRRRHDPGRQPGRVGAGDARLLADGRGRAALQPAAPPQGPRAAGGGREPEARGRRGALPRRAARRHPLHGHGRRRPRPRRGPSTRRRRPPPPTWRRPTRRRSSSPRGRPGAARSRLPAALPRAASAPRPSTGSARARGTSPGAPRRRAGRSRPATPSSPPG